MQAYVLTLFLSQRLLQHSRKHLYTPSWLQTREHLRKLIKVPLAENIMQEVCRADWTSHNINIFLHELSSGQVEFLF